jgi:hypothetical protein
LLSSIKRGPGTKCGLGVDTFVVVLESALDSPT